MRRTMNSDDQVLCFLSYQTNCSLLLLELVQIYKATIKIGPISRPKFFSFQFFAICFYVEGFFCRLTYIVAGIINRVWMLQHRTNILKTFREIFSSELIFDLCTVARQARIVTTNPQSQSELNSGYKAELILFAFKNVFLK